MLSKYKYNKLIREMKDLVKESADDTESAHAAADRLLIETLDLLGYKKITEEYQKVNKWYS